MSTATATMRKAGNTAKQEKEIWSSLLQSVSSGKRLAEKQLLVLGGTPEAQRELLSNLSTESFSVHKERKRSSSVAYPPVANEFALGYTYQDVLDADHEDMLARLSIHTLTKPSPAFLPLLRPLFTPQSVAHLLLVVLLDWHEPWNWIRQLQAWVRLLRSLLPGLPDDTKLALEDNIVEWRDRKRRGPEDESSTSSSSIDVTLPLGRGEWDEPLGIPLCLVCQNAEHMATLEKESGWKDRHFDFVQQYLRTLLLKHGGSLCYSMPHLTQNLRTLIHSSLGIESTLKKEQLRHNTTDRDMILVPPNFDSWGKIRILAEGFDFEAVSDAWSRDIQADSIAEDDEKADGQPHSSTFLYSEVIKPPTNHMDLTNLLPPRSSVTLDLSSLDTQVFLSEQLEILEGLAKEDERSQLLRDASKKPSTLSTSGATDVEEHIGPVQFNMGGIQMDAEDMVKRLKDREASRASDNEPPKTPTIKSDTITATTATAEDPTSNAKLMDFFAGLVKKPGGSATNSPRRTESKDGST